MVLVMEDRRPLLVSYFLLAQKVLLHTSASLLELKLSTTINSSDAVMGSSQVINTPPWERTALMTVTQRLVEAGCVRSLEGQQCPFFSTFEVSDGWQG